MFCAMPFFLIWCLLQQSSCWESTHDALKWTVHSALEQNYNFKFRSCYFCCPETLRINCILPKHLCWKRAAHGLCTIMKRHIGFVIVSCSKAGNYFVQHNPDVLSARHLHYRDMEGADMNDWLLYTIYITL